MSNKDFKVKNKLQVGGITSSGPVVSDAYGNLDSTSSIATQYGGTGTTTSPTSGQILYSSAGTTYAPATLAGLPGTYAVGNTASRPGSPSLGQIYSNTQTGYIEVYTSAGWSQLGVIPLAAATPTAADVGTNVAYGSGAGSVSFTPDSSGGLASSFTATSTPGSITGTGASSPVAVTGLTLGTSYTFTLVSSNGYGNSLTTSPSNSITTTSIPQAPTIGTLSNASGAPYEPTVTSSLTFTAGATGGKTITNYKYSTDGTTYTALSPSQTTSPLSISGLTSGSSNTISIKAVNSNGDSTASSASNSVTVSTIPQAPTIGTASITNATTISIPFTAGANGNSSITSYVTTSSPSVSLSTSGTTSPLTVTGTFAQGTAYTFTIKAVNANGQSLASSSSNSITPLPVAVVAGGTLGSDGTYYYRKFTGNGTLEVTGATNLIADLLSIAGGGSGGFGGSALAGGGGAGGLVYLSSQTFAPNNYSIAIGGGSPTVTGSPQSVRGSNTTVTSFTTAIGGGGGGPTDGLGAGVGGSGGSGGGGRGGLASNSSGGAGTSGQGFSGAGGERSTGAGGLNYGGGGGGATAVGSARNGGSASSAFSSWASATSSGVSGAYAGGGGAGGAQGSGLSSTAGTGGGGGAANGVRNTHGIAATANTGSGGGGGGYTDSFDGTGGAGGSGIVIIRYTRSQGGG